MWAWGTVAATATARGADTPAMHAALDALACLPADDDNNNNFANVGCRGGGRGGGWGTGDGMIMDRRRMSGMALRPPVPKNVVQQIYWYNDCKIFFKNYYSNFT